jgi:Tfp pilus assembly protein PilN
VRAVNLLPKDSGRRRKSRAEQAPLLVGLGLLVIVAAVLCGAFLMTSSTVQGREDELANAEAQLSILPPAPQGPTPVESGLADQERTRAAALTSALSRRVSWDRVLRELSLVLPDDIWLASLSAHSPASPATAAPPAAAAPGAVPTGLNLTGYTYTHASVARLLARLSVLPDLTNVQLQRSALAQIGTQTVVQFVILADVKPPEVTA